MRSIGNCTSALHFLYELPRRPLPDPKAGEIAYADEYRVCLRSIGGLEKLKAIEELKGLGMRSVPPRGSGWVRTMPPGDFQIEPGAFNSIGPAAALHRCKAA
jgi:hypothetical protein